MLIYKKKSDYERKPITNSQWQWGVQFIVIVRFPILSLLSLFYPHCCLSGLCLLPPAPCLLATVHFCLCPPLLSPPFPLIMSPSLSTLQGGAHSGGGSGVHGGPVPPLLSVLQKSLLMKKIRKKKQINRKAQEMLSLGPFSSVVLIIIVLSFILGLVIISVAVPVVLWSVGSSLLSFGVIIVVPSQVILLVPHHYHPALALIINVSTHFPPCKQLLTVVGCWVFLSLCPALVGPIVIPLIPLVLLWSPSCHCQCPLIDGPCPVIIPVLLSSLSPCHLCCWLLLFTVLLAPLFPFCHSPFPSCKQLLAAVVWDAVVVVMVVVIFFVILSLLSSSSLSSSSSHYPPIFVVVWSSPCCCHHLVISLSPCHCLTIVPCCPSLVLRLSFLIASAAGCCHCHFTHDLPHKQLLMGLEVDGVSGIIVGWLLCPSLACHPII